jgi:hypothetical protein
MSLSLPLLPFPLYNPRDVKSSPRFGNLEGLTTISRVQGVGDETSEFIENVKKVEQRIKNPSEVMEIEAFNGFIPNYPIMMSSSSDHGNVYGAYNYQFPSDNNNLVWSSPEAFVNQSDLSVSSPTLTTSFYYQSSTLNSTNSDENRVISSSVEVPVKNKRGRKKGTKKVEEQKPKAKKRVQEEDESSEISANPVVMKKRRLAANARERRRMNGLNTAFDR